MTTRTDLDIDFNPSPRIVEVRSPSTELIAQDTVDTLRIGEESTSGITEFKLLDASGKQSLGGGVNVGITVELLDTQIAFEPRLTPAETGTVTTPSDPPVINRITFSDSTATFITNGVARGSLVINFTDNSIADVVSVDSETQLTTKTLANGSDNSFDTADVYHVFNIIQCDLSGGNIVSVDDVGGEISSVLPTAFTQVVRTSSASATLQDLSAIQFASFEGGVWVDVINGFTGTDYPTGTREHPSNNIPDAIAIDIERGFELVHIIGSITLDTGDDVSGFTILGQNQAKTVVTCNPGAETTGTEFDECSVMGTLDGGSLLKECLISDLAYVDGQVIHCLINPGTITISGSTTAHFLQCVAGNSSAATPTVDIGSGSDVVFREWTGPMTLINKTGPERTSIDMLSGAIIIESSCVAGEIVIRGHGEITDNSGAGCTVSVDVMTVQGVVDGVWNEAKTSHEISGSFGEMLGKKVLTLAKFLGLK